MILASPAHLARHGCCPAKVIPQPREEDMQMMIEPDVFAKARVEVLEALDLVGPGMPRSLRESIPAWVFAPLFLLQGVVFLAARSCKDVCRSLLGATRGRQWRGS